MQKARLLLHKEFKKAKIDPRIYGSFVEHMGRVVYTGIYEPGHPQADEEGFRKDVMEAVKEAGVSIIRYPGGNFVSGYDWEDGVGPKDSRPVRLDLAWKSLETNQFGTDEFMHFAEKSGAEPMMAVNLGVNGIKDALHYLEYCNFPGGTKYSDMRKDHGVEQPYGIKTWCLGNEMDGDWQLGHKTAEEYGRLAQETAKAMKLMDSSIELVSCGSSLNTMATYPQWEATSLDYTYDYVDYISLHQYFDGHEKSFSAFLAQADEMNEFIENVGAVCDFIKTKKRSDKKLFISFDEWGVWTRSSDETVNECDANPWQEAPVISEMIYSFEDALLFGGMLMALIKNADRVKIACQSLLANISAMIMTKKGGEMWLQTIYYPFAQAARYAQGTVMDTRLDCDKMVEGGKEIPLVDALAVENGKELVILAINRNAAEEVNFQIKLEEYKPVEVKEHLVLYHDDMQVTNEINHEAVIPMLQNDCKIMGNKVELELKPASWNVIVIRVE